VSIKQEEKTDEPLTNPKKMRAVHGLIDNIGLDTDILSLCQWCAAYYHYPLGEVCHLALPSLLRKPVPAPERSQISQWCLTPLGEAYSVEAFGRASKQRELWLLVQKHSLLTPEHIKHAGLHRATLNILMKKGLLSLAHTATMHSAPLEINDNNVTLTQEQADALAHITTDQFNTYLLDGITGSGKTEVYLQAIAQVLLSGKQALVLVPEIGLTPQTVNRFKQRFNVAVATLHSGMSDKQRFDIWLDAQQGRVSIIIGTRSAVFTPFPNLGLIIVDEEHDLSYKQQDGVRYSARDTAIVRAQKKGIPIILGSATPSLETLNNAVSGRFTHLHLRQRATKAPLPTIHCVHQEDAELSPGILQSIQSTLDKQQQALVFINRRGYAPTLICQECGWMSECTNCDARMTIHQFQQRNQHLHCHHCGTKAAVPPQCPHCHSSKLHPLGQGTQRSEEALKQHFTNTPILRIDRDSMSKKGELEEALAIINSERPCILVGTQMLAKGHHFANVSLAIVLGLDNSFFSSDFRGTERMAQLLTQVAGRAGREQRKGIHQGTVLLQTQFSDHPHLQQLIQDGYGALALQLLSERHNSDMPPYKYLALIRCHSPSPHLSIQFLHQARQIAQHLPTSTKQLQYLGPLAAPVEKRNNRYHYYLQIKSDSREALHQLLQPLCLQLEQQRINKGLHWLIDVDAQEV